VKGHWSTEYIGIPLSGLTPSYMCTCPKQGPEFPSTNKSQKRTTYVIYNDAQYNIYLKNVKQQIFGSWYGRHSIGHPFNILIDLRNRMCSGSWSLSIGINISTKSSLPTANSSTLFLHVTVAVLLDPCIRASSYRTNRAY